MTDFEVLIQQLITGCSNGMIIALIAIGYTMVYGIIGLINFAHGDLFMLGCFFSLTILNLFSSYINLDGSNITLIVTLIFLTAFFCAGLNYLVDRYCYRALRKSTRLAPLVSAIGVSFVFLNFGLFWGGMPLEFFQYGQTPASPKDFPSIVPYKNLLSETSNIFITQKELLVFFITVPILIALNFLVKKTKIGKAMRAVALDTTAARLMGIDVDKVIASTFIIGGALAGIASVVYAAYNNTIYYQMGYRVGMDAFTATVLGGIGSLNGAVLGGLLIGTLRAFSDQYISTSWTNVVVFLVLIIILVFKPTGILGSTQKEKV